MPTNTKCHPTRSQGFVRIEAMVSPTRKADFIKYCKQKKMTQARVIQLFLQQLLGPEDDRPIQLPTRRKVRRKKTYRKADKVRPKK